MSVVDPGETHGAHNPDSPVSKGHDSGVFEEIPFDIEKINDFRSHIPDKYQTFDDITLNRFMSACPNNQKKALKLFLDYAQFREQVLSEYNISRTEDLPLYMSCRGYQGIPDITYDGGKDSVPGEFRSFWKFLGGSSFHKTSKDGIPVFIDRTGLCDLRGLASECSLNTLQKWHLLNLEFLLGRIFKSCSNQSGGVINKQITILDCKGIGIRHVHPKGIYLLKKLVEFDVNTFIEVLNKIYIVNAPPVFWKLWVIIKKSMDKRTLSKVVFCGSDFQKELLEIIPPENLPVEYGGTCTCDGLTGGCVPSPMMPPWSSM